MFRTAFVSGRRRVLPSFANQHSLAGNQYRYFNISTAGFEFNGSYECTDLVGQVRRSNRGEADREFKLSYLSYNSISLTSLL